MNHSPKRPTRQICGRCRQLPGRTTPATPAGFLPPAGRPPHEGGHLCSHQKSSRRQFLTALHCLRTQRGWQPLCSPVQLALLQTVHIDGDGHLQPMSKEQPVVRGPHGLVQEMGTAAPAGGPVCRPRSVTCGELSLGEHETASGHFQRPDPSAVGCAAKLWPFGSQYARTCPGAPPGRPHLPGSPAWPPAPAREPLALERRAGQPPLS